MAKFIIQAPGLSSRSPDINDKELHSRTDLNKFKDQLLTVLYEFEWANDVIVTKVNELIETIREVTDGDPYDPAKITEVIGGNYITTSRTALKFNSYGNSVAERVTLDVDFYWLLGNILSSDDFKKRVKEIIYETNE